MDHRSHGDFQGRSSSVLAVSIATLLLATIFVLARLISRAAIVGKVAVDDYFMILALLIAIGLSSALCYGSAWGLGRHELDVPPEWQPTLLRADYAFTVLYQPALMMIKTSILAFYLTLSKTSRTFRWACFATLFVVNAGGFALTMLTAFQCNPVSVTFDLTTPSTAHCTDIVTIYLSSAPLNILTDLAILFLPMPILTSMRLPRKTKIILIITFSFGIFVAAVDVVRIAYLQSAAMTRLAELQSQASSSDDRTSEFTDFSWYAAFSFMWSVVEVNVGIMCACVPGLKPLVSRFLPYMLRDPEDAPSTFGSTSAPSGASDLPDNNNMPSMPDDVHYRDFGSISGPSVGQRASVVESPMGMMDFLTTPDMNELPLGMPRLERSQTACTNTTRHTRPDEPAFFDFVRFDVKKNVVQMTNRESIFPISMVTILFFIWGFEYGLLAVLNAQFQRVAMWSPGQSSAAHSAYFAGYLMPLVVGRMVLTHWGFKACYTIGLTIYACGTLIFWPAAVLTSFPAFIVTNFIVASGLSILEVAANPFIALCGPPQYSEIRLNLSQGVQAIGSVVAPLIANRAFFHKADNAPSLVDTQWAYLGISLATILLAVAYYYIPLPEVTNTELEDAAERLDGANKAKWHGIPLIWITLSFGVFSQFCYVGGQEVFAQLFTPYLAATNPNYNAADYMAIAHTAFAVSRFIAAGLGFLLKPRHLIAIFYAGAIVFSSLAMHYSGPTGLAMLILVFFCEGPLFSLIFGQSLRGMGRHTKFASTFITAAVSGGAVFSPISSHLASAPTHRAQYSLVVGTAVLAAGGLPFALLLNGSSRVRALVNPIRDTAARRRSSITTSSAASRTLAAFWRRGSHQKKNRLRNEDAEIEYKER